MSELWASRSPSRPIVVPVFLIYGALTIAFAVGLWKRGQSLRISAWAIGAVGAISLVAPLVATNLRADPRTTSTNFDAPTMVMLVCFLVAIGFAANAYGPGFGLYSFATMLVLLLTQGDATGLWSPYNPTPWIGVNERLVIYGFMLWQAVLAINALRSVPKPTATSEALSTLRSSYLKRRPTQVPHH